MQFLDIRQFSDEGYFTFNAYTHEFKADWVFAKKWA